MNSAGEAQDWSAIPSSVKNGGVSCNLLLSEAPRTWDKVGMLGW